jgi:hypothetical protein
MKLCLHSMFDGWVPWVLLGSAAGMLLFWP